jgi:O-acetyl-ADP-ribose deacetylase (regulator of RNase III)
LADSKNLKSISFPAISTGIFGFPIQRCAEIMLQTTIDYLKGSPAVVGSPAVCLAGKTGLEKVVFCLYGRDSYQVFENQLTQEILKK